MSTYMFYSIEALFSNTPFLCEKINIYIANSLCLGQGFTTSSATSNILGHIILVCGRLPSAL